VLILGVRKVGDDLHASWPEISAPTQQIAQERCLAEANLQCAISQNILTSRIPVDSAHLCVNCDSQFTPSGLIRDAHHRLCQKKND